jgi:hypothetical protein
MSVEDDLRQQLYDSFKNRAIIYWLIYDELCGELGPERAEKVMQRAIERRGRQKGEALARFGPDDLAGLKEAFFGAIPDQGRMFQPEVLGDDGERLDVKFHACPLKSAWQEIGLSEEQVATLCRIAARVDNGTFEAAGFQFEADTYQPGGDGCCRLHISKG